MAFVDAEGFGGIDIASPYLLVGVGASSPYSISPSSISILPLGLSFVSFRCAREIWCREVGRAEYEGATQSQRGEQ